MPIVIYNKNLYLNNLLILHYIWITGKWTKNFPCGNRTTVHGSEWMTLHLRYISVFMLWNKLVSLIANSGWRHIHSDGVLRVHNKRRNTLCNQCKCSWVLTMYNFLAEDKINVLPVQNHSMEIVSILIRQVCESEVNW
jgi:hypothetical protein